MAYRIDMAASPLRAPKRLPDGRIVVDAIITRVGVFSYHEGGRERRELRLPEDVFAPASLDTYTLAPVTNDHPPKLLDTSNMRHHAVGAVGAVRRDGDFIRGPLSVFDADVISAMERGKSAVSAGYHLDLDETPGEHPLFGRYDARQRNIRVNHVAIVDEGRAGPEARIRMDAQGPCVGVLVPYQQSLSRLPAEMDVFNRLGAMRAPRRES